MYLYLRAVFYSRCKVACVFISESKDHRAFKFKCKYPYIPICECKAPSVFICECNIPCVLISECQVPCVLISECKVPCVLISE